MNDNLPDTVVTFNDMPWDKVAEMEIRFQQSPTGRTAAPTGPAYQHLPKSRGGFRKEGVEFEYQSGDLSQIEELCAAALGSCKPLAEQNKHPLIFKLVDLWVDENEFTRMEQTLLKNQETEKTLGWRSPPLFIETNREVDIDNETAGEMVRRLSALANRFNVCTYFGTKPALKNILYTYMYGAKMDTIDKKGVVEMTVEKSEELTSPCRIAIVGNSGQMDPYFRKFRDLIESERLLDNTLSLVQGYYQGDMFIKEGVEVSRKEKDWEQPKIRRGKGHNKFKRKGKK